MHWIIQENMFGELNHPIMIEFMTQKGISFSEHKVVPFSGELIPPYANMCNVSEYCSAVCSKGCKGCNKDHKVICMGSYSMRNVAKAMGWVPGVFDIEEMDFEVQNLMWPHQMLNSDSVVTRFEDSEFTQDLMFVRPCADSKAFIGQVMDRKEFYEWKYKVCELGDDYGSELTKDTYIQISYPKTIYSEHRFWIVNGKIVTASTYKVYGRPHYDGTVNKAFYKYVEERIREWCPHDAFVIDVCNSVQGIKIVEINTLNASGFYVCNIEVLILALEEAFG